MDAAGLEPDYRYLLDVPPLGADSSWSAARVALRSARNIGLNVSRIDLRRFAISARSNLPVNVSHFDMSGRLIESRTFTGSSDKSAQARTILYAPSRITASGVHLLRIICDGQRRDIRFTGIK
jgi:hypothetical protein